MKAFTKIIMFVSLAATIGCGNHTDGKLTKVKSVDDVIFQVQYKKDINFSDHQINESGGLNFLLSISSSQQDQNIIYRGIQNEEALRNRIYFLNFRFEELIQLKVGNKAIFPSLCILESTNQLSNNLRFVLAFDEGLSDLAVEEIDLLVMDMVFETGIHHFSFSKKEMLEFSPINKAS